MLLGAFGLAPERPCGFRVPHKDLISQGPTTAGLLCLSSWEQRLGADTVLLGQLRSSEYCEKDGCRMDN